jgi:two-component system, OmpR family, sensor kinase
MRVLPRTLRGRLIAGLLALLTAACATVGLATYLAVERSLSSELTSDLQTATGLAYQCYNPASKPPAGGGAGGQPAPGSGQGENPGTNASPSPDDRLSGHSSGPASANPRTALDSSDPGAPNPLPATGCQGLDEGTFVAALWQGKGQARIIGGKPFTLSSADLKTLLGITPWKAPNPANWSNGQDIPPHTSYLSEAGGTYLLTAISDPDGDGSVYITGLPLSTLHDMLRDVALVEAAVFGAVLVLAGVLGTCWVGFSLRPLRRVAATASQVAELPLESGEVSLPAGVPDTDPATETGQVGLAFNRMLGHVQTALRRRAASEARLRRFAADASHELRTPLAAIRGYAELALLHPGDSTEAVTHALGRVLSESKRMSVLVDDLLLLARLDAGRPLSSAPVDLSRLAIDATSDAQAARPGHRWILELPDDPVLASGDEHRLHQVLANLLANAGRHTPDGTSVTVRVSDALPDGEPGSGAESVSRGTLPPAPRVVLTVTNNGPGIPATLLPDLFERFTRADTSRSHATNASSTGLGLAIVEAVVGAHGGAVLVTSRPGMTRFAIVLPRLTEQAAPVPPARR